MKIPHLMISPKNIWIKFNIVLFSGYAFFAMGSIFWPSRHENLWCVLILFVTCIMNVIIVFGLANRTPRTHYLIVFLSPVIAIHFLIFTLMPLGMDLAFIGPARSFYSLFFTLLSKLGNDMVLLFAFISFNVTMILVHLINPFYFTIRRNDGMFNAGPS